jgi:hypothetical protein
MRISKKYFHWVMFEDETIAALANDGLIYLFEPKDIVPQLNKDYDYDSGGWYYNMGHDRYCAERGADGILVNPSIVSTIFGMPVLHEN